MSHGAGDPWPLGQSLYFERFSLIENDSANANLQGPSSPLRDDERIRREDSSHYERDSRDSRDKYSRSGERDRDHDRDRERDRDSDRGGSSHSRRDRDRRERDEYRRKRDRERERDRRSRPSDRDMGSMRRRDEGRVDERSSRSARYGDGGGGRSSRRSRSPERRSGGGRERVGMEDLKDVVSIDKRQRMKTLWDVKPAGYENVTTEMAKLSGLFPLPGAPRPIDYAKLQGLVPNLPGGSDGLNGGSGQSGNLFLNGPGNSLRLESSRSSKRVLITGFEAGAYTHADIASYFNDLFRSLQLDTPLPDNMAAVVQSLAADSGALVVLEFRSSEMATIAVAFDGNYFQDDDKKFVMNIRRPADYITPVISALDIAAAAAAAPKDDNSETGKAEYKSKVPDSGKKISIAGIPSYLNEEQVVEVLKAFGLLEGFQMIKDKHTRESRGVAFCEFRDSDITAMACSGLNGMELGDGTLRVKLATKGLDVGESAIPFAAADGMSSLASTIANNNRMSEVVEPDSNPVAKTPVLLLLNMMTPEELVDNDEYREIREDIETECAKFGSIVSLVIPRPDPKTVGKARLIIQIGAPKPQETKVVSGVGKVFVKFDSYEACKKAHHALGGRKFSDRTVISSYYPEENFDLGIF